MAITDLDRSKIHEAIHATKSIVIYGSTVIRNELRDVPKKIRLKGRSLRVDLLTTYDDFVKATYPVTREVSGLADAYFQLYKSLSGSAAREPGLLDGVRFYP